MCLLRSLCAWRSGNLDAVLEEVNGRLPMVFGCSGVSVPQVLLFARAAQRAGADAVIAMAPAQTNAAMKIVMAPNGAAYA